MFCSLVVRTVPLADHVDHSVGGVLGAKLFLLRTVYAVRRDISAAWVSAPPVDHVDHPLPRVSSAELPGDAPSFSM